VWEYLKNKSTIILIVCVTIGFLFYAYSCEPKVTSLFDKKRTITRQELQLELDQLLALADIKMAELEKQEKIRGIILQNALILVQGQPFNPAGLITAIASTYGIIAAATKTKEVVKNAKRKRNNNKSTT